MTSVLDMPRTVTIGNRTETFRNYDHLAERAELLIQSLQRIEAGMAPDGSNVNWNALADAAEALEDILAVQTEWLREHDDAIALEIESIRRNIRNLNTSGTNDAAGDS